MKLVDSNMLRHGDKIGSHLVHPSYLTGVKFFLENGSPVCLGSGKFGSVFAVEHNGELKALKVFFVPTSLLLLLYYSRFGEVKTAGIYSRKVFLITHLLISPILNAAELMIHLDLTSFKVFLMTHLLTMT